uniref:Uncharacterized protein n=1 Tax=Panagrolaimus davidi TaxID=227884 RepID=A0A914QWM6_9BILA
MSKVSDSNKKKYLVSVVGSGSLIMIEIMDERTQQFYKKIDVLSVKKMFTFLLSLKDELKAVFLSVTTLETSEYQSNFEASKAIKDFLLLHSIPCHFYSAEYLLCFKMWIATDISSKVDDVVLTVNVGNNEMVLAMNTFGVKGYKISTAKVLREMNFEDLVMIYLSNNASLKALETALRTNKSYDVGSKLIVLDSDKIRAIGKSGKSILEMAKWFFDRSYVKFHFPQLVPRTVDILSITGNSQKELITAENNTDTPFKESVVIAKSVQQCLMIQHQPSTKKTLETLKMDQNCHRRKIVLFFESECFPELKVESIIIPEIKELPKKLNGICDMKIPLIGFFGYSAVICVYKNGKYKFLDSWNGLYGNELFINFEESKAKYGMESIKAGNTKMSSVVYDLIKIMSMPSEKIVVKEEWKFVITKNAENPVLIEFVNHEGRKQAGTPSFLMAMLLKEMLKRIKNELNEEKPKEIGFCFFDKMFEDEKKRVGNGLKEACELLKVESKFIDV